MFSRTTVYEVTEHRVFIALNVAAATGAMLIVMMFVGPKLASVNWRQLAEWIPVYLLAHLVWFFGITLLGGPIWMAMHKFGLRHWIHAGLTGGVVLGITCTALMTGFFTGSSSFFESATNSSRQWTWIDGHLTAEGWLDALRISLWISPLGVILGLVIWRIAYRPTAA